MANVATITPLNQFFDTNGSPLNSGYLFFGSPNQDPEQFPVQMFWDAAGTVPALQPIRTISGYPSRGGSPAIIYGPDSYSLRVRSSSLVQVLYAPLLGGLSTSASLSAADGSSLVSFIQAGTGAITRTAQSKMREIISVFDFGAIGDGIVNDTAAFSNSVLSGAPVFVPKTANFYSLTSLSNAAKELLYGPGIVKVNGVIVAIPTVASISNPDTAAVNVIKSTLSPTTNTTNGSVGFGAINSVVKRTGGNGQYGNWLSQYLSDKQMVAGEFEVGITSWATATNLTGAAGTAQIFGMWAGANTPSPNLGETFTGGAAIGMEINVGNRWANYSGPLDVGSTRYTVGLQIVPDVLPALDGLDSVACTISVASPAVVTINSHGYIVNQGIVFGGSGTLPTGITAGTTYYILAAGFTANTFQISASIGGAAIDTTGVFVAPITALASYSAGFGLLIGPSVHGHAWWNGTLLRFDSIVAGGYGALTYGGTLAVNSPQAVNLVGGNWVNGIDFSGAVFSGAAINFSFANQTSATATAGAVVSPGNFQGFIKVAVSGTIVKIPYFQN